MPRVSLVLALQCAVVIVAALGSQALAEPSKPTPEAIAEEIGHALAKRDFAAAVVHFSAALAAALPPSKLEAGWAELNREAGSLKSIGVPSHADGHGLVVIPITFEHALLDLKVAVTQNQVTALRIVPHEDPVPAWTPPSYADRTRFDAIELEVGHAPFALSATLTVPHRSERAPALVLVHGSGPGDRNESLGPNRPFQDLAEGLSSRGIAVLRYDKRTRLYPQSFADASGFTVKEETIDDARAAVALLRGRDDIDPHRIVLLGHSLGGTLAPRIAAADPSIAGIVIMAGASRPLPTIMVEQLIYLSHLDGSDGRQAAAAIDHAKTEAARALAARTGDKGAPIFGIPATYWADLKRTDPVATAQTLSIPILILQGLRDYQVTPDNLALFQTGLAGRKNVSIETFPTLDHLFMPGSVEPDPRDYQKPGHVDATVVARIARFIEAVPAP